MKLIFMGIDKPSGNTIFHYPCRQHQISFKPDQEMHDALKNVPIESEVEMEVYVEAKIDVPRTAGAPLQEDPKWATYVAYSVLIAGAFAAAYGIVKFFS